MLNILLGAVVLPFGLSAPDAVESKGTTTASASFTAATQPVAGVSLADQEGVGLAYGLGWHVAITGQVNSLSRINDGGDAASKPSDPATPSAPACVPTTGGVSAPRASSSAEADFGSERAWETRLGVNVAPWGGPVALGFTVAPETGATETTVSGRLPLGHHLALRGTGGFVTRPRVESGDQVIDDAVAWGAGAELRLSPRTAAVMGVHGERGLLGAASPTSWAAGLELTAGPVGLSLMGGGGVVDGPAWNVMTVASWRFGAAKAPPRVTPTTIALADHRPANQPAAAEQVPSDVVAELEERAPAAPEEVKAEVDDDTILDSDPAALAQVGDAMVLIGEPVFFQVNQPRIRMAFRPTLDALARHLDAHPELTLIEVDGHADATGTDQYNDTLSEKRADAVVDYLVSRGISRDRLVPAGFGEHDPAAPNDTAHGRAQNRRVVIRVLSRD